MSGKRSLISSSSKGQKTPSPSKSNAYCVKLVERFISSNKIAIFSKTWCPWCKKAKELFNSYGLQFGTMELDMEGEGAALQLALKDISGQKTVPNIFINGKHIGGYSELAPLSEAGVLEEFYEGLDMDFQYDLVIVGGGSGGLSAANEAAKLGKKVALCDFVEPTPLGTKWGLGGTCVNVGCIPKKLMHRAAQIHQDISDGIDFGWSMDPGTVSHNWEKMVDHIQKYIKSLNFSYRKSLMTSGVKYYNSFGSFKDRHTLHLKSGSEEATITARNFIIAVGCRPKYLNLKGEKQLCLTSDDLFSMTSPPGDTLVVGASYVALECAGFLAGLGYNVTVMVRSILLRGFDQQMAEKIESLMTSYGVKFVKNCVPLSFEKDEHHGTIKVAGGNTNKTTFSSSFNTVLIAIGRRACTDNLNLGSIGVKINLDSRKIIVDEKERSTVSNIFAIGDVAEGKLELTPVAIQAGKLLVQRLYNLKTVLMDYKNVPTTVFTPCEYGCVGYTEDEAMNIYGQTKIEVYHQEFNSLESALNTCTRFHPQCYAKLIALKEDKEEYIIGAHILSPNAGEVIQGFALAIKMGATKSRFDDLVGVHPTIAEVFTSLQITKSSGERVAPSNC